MVDVLFRFTNSGDTIGSLGPTEIIEFNTGVVPDTTGRMVSTSFRMVSDLNPHPNPDTQLNQIQDSLLGVVEVNVAGYFVDHNDTLGPRNLYNWSVDEDVNDDFRKGRFGISIASMNGILTLVPTVGLNGTGYMLSDIDVIDFEEPRNEIGFTAKFFLNGAAKNV